MVRTVTPRRQWGSANGMPLHAGRALVFIVLPVFVVIAAMVTASLAGVHGNLQIDLEVYRFGVEAWWNDGDIYGTLPRVSDGAQLPFLYPPFAVLALSPFAVLPWPAAVIALFAINIICVGATLYVVLRKLWPRLNVVTALAITSPMLPLALLLEPLRNTFSYGQINIVLMGLVAVDCLARKTVWPRGVGVGIAVAIKLTPAAFLLFFLVRKDFRAAIVTTLSAAVATGIGFIVDAKASMRYWFDGFGVTDGFSGVPYHTNQTIAGTLARFEFIEPVSTIVKVALVVVLVLAVGYAMYRSDPPLALMLNAGLALLVSPTSWSHHWVWIAPAVLVLVAYTVRRWNSGSPAALSWFAVTMMTVPLFYMAPFMFLPGGENRELDWSPAQQLMGATYAWFVYALLLGYAVTLWRNRNGSDPDPPTVDNERERVPAGAH